MFVKNFKENFGPPSGFSVDGGYWNMVCNGKMKNRQCLLKESKVVCMSGFKRSAGSHNAVVEDKHFLHRPIRLFQQTDGLYKMPLNITSTVIQLSIRLAHLFTS